MHKISKLMDKAISSINSAMDDISLDAIRLEYLGKSGHITLEILTIQKLPIEKRQAAGLLINNVKKELIKQLSLRKKILYLNELKSRLKKETLDISLPGRCIENGNLHPITKIINCIEKFFSQIGFVIINGLEIEDHYHNFDALNIHKNHPVRDDHDTFWFDTIRLLRTQTSSIQIRAMKKQKPPIRIISSGRVYRNDYDSTHTPMFHQMEGLVVDNCISFANLKSVMHDFLNNFFEKNVQIRFRPSFFPFTEPSAEVDVMKNDGNWLEVLGCGMIHPNVLHNVNINSEIYSGFAFGIGIERLTMLRYGIIDLRAFFENDLRFLKQFK